MNILKKIDALRDSIDALRPFDEIQLQTWQERLRIDWTYNSNALEGNTLTYGETAFFLREGLTSEGRPLKDFLEAKNHAEAIDYLTNVVKMERPLTEGFIKELHGFLFRGITESVALGAGGKRIAKPLTAGAYKTRPNHILTLSGTIHRYTDPLHVPDEMEKLLSWLHEEKKLHPAEQAALFHYRFVCIHPFDDGNGRMARLLMNLILMQVEYSPCVIRNSKRRIYLQCLEHADKTGSMQKLIEFVAEELRNTQEIMLRAMQGKPLPPVPEETPNRHERHERILKVLHEDSLSIGELLRLLPGFKRPTLKSDLQVLVKTGKIRRNGRGKGATYEVAP